MTNPVEAPFRCELETSVANDIKTSIVHCHGRLTSQTAGQIKDMVKPLIPQGGVVIIELGDVTYLDSLGLGTLVGLKVSAINEGSCQLKLKNLTPRLQDLLRLTNLTSLFAS